MQMNMNKMSGMKDYLSRRGLTRKRTKDVPLLINVPLLGLYFFKKAAASTLL